MTNITTITGTATVRPDLIGPLPAIVPTPNLDTNGFPVSYQWFDGQTTVCDPRIAAPAPPAHARRRRSSRCRTTRPAWRISETSDAT